MSFLGEVSPTVDWKRKLVSKNGKRFSVTSIARPRAVAHVSGSTLVQNSFGALDADCALDDDVCVQATPCNDDDGDDDDCTVLDVARTPRAAVQIDDHGDKPRAAGDVSLGCKPRMAQHSTCISCGKVVDEGISKCKRCKNNSFAGTAAQQGVSSVSATADVSTTPLSGEVEVVPLN